MKIGKCEIDTFELAVIIIGIVTVVSIIYRA